MLHSYDEENLSNAKVYMLVASAIALLGLGVIQFTPYEGAGRIVVILTAGPALMFLYKVLKVFKPARESKGGDAESKKESQEKRGLHGDEKG